MNSADSLRVNLAWLITTFYTPRERLFVGKMVLGAELELSQLGDLAGDLFTDKMLSPGYLSLPQLESKIRMYDDGCLQQPYH